MIIAPNLPDFQYLKVTRSGGIRGVTQTPNVDQHLRAAVTDTFAGARLFTLDAQAAQELMTSLTALASHRSAPSTTRGYDMFHYDIELAWGRNVYVVHSVDVGADEALHGVMMAANNLITDTGLPRAGHMTLHNQAPT
ncbi:MAG: hypothetical protein H7123_07665 [Thermoleophilia bacterium]|nr:hypothetical protein [Thermoleophilia bacterium]